MKEYQINHRQNNTKSCFVCGLDNPFGLKARFYETPEKEIIAIFTPGSEHQSYPGRLHGGVISAILDEAIGRAIFCYSGSDSVWGVTVELTVQYKKPVPTDYELKVVGRITSDSRRIYEASGELILPDGSVAATAQGRYMKLSLEAISRQSENFLENEWGAMPSEEVPSSITI